MRSSLLDIEVAPNSGSPQPATVIRVDIQAWNGLRRGQRDRQLQPCVPLVTLEGDSYRLRDHQARADTLRTASTGTRQPLR